MLWAGTLPGGLFRSTDRGASWQLVESLWNEPLRRQWAGGGYDWAGIHSIAVDPRDPRRLLVGVSCGGCWRSEDGGATWALSAKGMRAAYMPPEQAYDENSQDPHRVVQCPAAPDTVGPAPQRHLPQSRQRAELDRDRARRPAGVRLRGCGASAGARHRLVRAGGQGRTPGAGLLVAGSTMLGRSLGNLEGQDFGFERDGRVLVSVGRPSASITGERLTAFYRDLEGRLARIPGVQSAGLALYNPLTSNWGEGILIAGKPTPAPGEQTGASWDRVSTDYLQQLGVTLVRGRHFTAADNETAENVAVVNGAFVRRFFKPEEDPIDQRFGLNLPENVNTFRIVGVVDDARFASFQLDRPMRPMFFVPLTETVNYANEMAKLQLTRQPFPLPEMRLNPEVRSIFEFEFEDFELVNYQAHPHIKAEISV